MARFLKSSQNPFHDAHTRMRAAPMLIHMGTRDDYELGERPCDPLVAMWPEAARSSTTVRYVADATHAFDSQTGPRQFYEPGAQAGRGATIVVPPSPKDAEEARQAIVEFFVSPLEP